MKHHEVYDKLYAKETGKLDRNLDRIFEYLKPQAHKIYYDRKVEYVNLVENQKKLEKNRRDNVRKRVSV